MWVLSPRHDASYGWRWRRRSPDMGGTTNILSEQSRAANKGWPSSLGVGQGASNSWP